MTDAARSYNAALKEMMVKGQQPTQFMEVWDHLQLQSGMFYNSELPGLHPAYMPTSTRTSRGLCQRIKGAPLRATLLIALLIARRVVRWVVQARRGASAAT